MGMEEVGSAEKALHLLLCGRKDKSIDCILAGLREAPGAWMYLVTEEGHISITNPRLFHLEHEAM